MLALHRWLPLFRREANPVALRLVRQDLRSAATTSTFLLLLVVCAGAAVIAALAAGVQARPTTGAGLFLAVLWAWGFAAVVVQGLSVFRAVSQERQDDTWDLVELTGLSPGRVLRGLLIAHLANALMVASALAPFAVMAYLLRGIDLAVIGFVLWAVPMAGLLAASLAVFTATLTTGKALRTFLGGVLSLVLLGGWIMLCVALSQSDGLGRFLGKLVHADSESIFIMLIALDAWLVVGGLCLTLGGSRLRHRADDRSSGPRSVALLVAINLALWLPMTLAILWLEHLSTGQPWHDQVTECLGILPAILAVVGIIWAALVGWLGQAEDEALSPRQHRACVAGGRLRRAWMAIVGPGAVRARRWFLVVLAASLMFSLISLMVPLDPGGEDRMRRRVLIGAWLTAMSAATWLAVGDLLLRRTPLARIFDTADLRRVAMLAILGLWSLLPVLLAWLIDPRHADSSVLLLCNPVWAPVRLAHEPESAGIIAVSVVGLLCIIWLYVRSRSAVEVIERVAARPDERNPRA
ncbi:hypothetical protein LBMAG53_35950 [Planctomycetota bacterium]|nr:hypothetical protein LBMAG53_35950 [Planctomycetota bacterium]